MKTIMIIDEEKSLLEEIKSLLQSDDFEIVTADNSREAIQLMEGDKEDDFGLILINTKMPDSKAPALFSMKPKTKKNIDTSNVEDFLQKPYTKEELLEFIKKKID